MQWFIVADSYPGAHNTSTSTKRVPVAPTVMLVISFLRRVTMYRFLCILMLAFAFACGSDNGPTAPEPEPPAPTPVQPHHTRDAPRLGPGDSCEFGGSVLRVREDGFGCVGPLCAGTGVTINDFSATKIAGTDRWRIDSLPGG